MQCRKYIQRSYLPWKELFFHARSIHYLMGDGFICFWVTRTNSQSLMPRHLPSKRSTTQKSSRNDLVLLLIATYYQSLITIRETNHWLIKQSMQGQKVKTHIWLVMYELVKYKFHQITNSIHCICSCLWFT